MKHLIGLTIISVMVCSAVSAQCFSETDFERMVMNHPMMKNYVKENGHFKNTEYEFRNIQDIRSENASIAEELDFIKSKRLSQSLNILETAEGDEESFWSNISELDTRKNKLERAKMKNENLIGAGGDPGFERLVPITDGITNDLLVPLYDKNMVVVNKLPRFYAPPPDLCGRALGDFLNKPDSDFLKNYLEKAPVIALMFSKSDKTILYQQKGVKNE